MTKRISFSGLYLILSIGYSGSANAQDSSNTIGHISIASPTAASLGKYGDIPVSYHTGVPQIDIPIYTVQSGSLKLPISLSYHASGLKVLEPSGWVGAGWSLNAGGVITRTVMGAPDDRGYFTSNVLYGHYTDFGFNSYLNSAGSPDDVNFSRGWKDGEPDLYFFNFGGYAGKFYFNDDRTPILLPEQDFKIQPFLVSGQGFTGFIITTPDGTRYFFGQAGNNGPVNPVEATNPFTLLNGPANTTAATSSWFLNKMLSADGMDSLTLRYQQENYSYYTISTSPVLGGEYNQIGPDQTIRTGMNLVKSLVAGVRLSKISFPNGTISFTPSASPRTDLSGSAGLLVNNTLTDDANTSSYGLGSITISNNNGFCKKDSLYLGYFYDASSLSPIFLQNYGSYNLHSDQYRLRLDSIKETSCNGAITISPYKFTYFTEQVPRRLSFGADHWGYPNGATSNPTLVPTFTTVQNGTPHTTAGGNRDAAWPAMRAGSLQQITYPTGGSTQFDFEPKNIYSFTNSTLQLVPLRSLVVHEFGQSGLTQTLGFTLSGTNSCTVTVNNTSSNWSPTFTILDNTSTVVYNSGLINFSSSISVTLQLPAGNYTATLSFPSNSGSNLINGADAAIGQWQYVPATTTLTVGGLRIKTVTNNDGITTNNVITSYNYTGGGSQSTAVLYSIPIYIQVLRSDINKLVWGQLPAGAYCSPNGCLSCDAQVFGQNIYNVFYVSAGSIQPMNSLQGENMGYNEVDVSQTGNGHSVYRYYGSNLWSQNINDVCQRSITQNGICDGSIPNFPFAPVPFEFMRDELQYEAHFNQAGQVLTEKYYFPQYAPDPMITPGHVTGQVFNWSTFTEYNLQSAKKIRDSVASMLYDPATGGRVVSSNTTYYNSPFHHQPTRTVSSTSTGDSLATNTKYALDFRISSCDAIPDSLSYYLSTIHNDSVWLNTNINSCTPQVNNSTNCRWSTFTQWREMMAQARVNFIRYRRRSYANDSSNLQNACYLTALATADPLLKPILRLQNMYSNVPIETSEWKNLNLRHASFTRYDTSVTPAGFAYPGRTRLINLRLPASSFAGAVVSGNTIALDSRYADESIYQFASGKPQQVTGHDGVSTSYLWDYLNTQPIAKVTNAGVNQIAYTSFESDGTGTWSVGSTSRDATKSVTGNKSYLLNSDISRSGLNSASTYFVSYWTQNSSPFTIAGTITGYPVRGKSFVVGKISNWSFWIHKITGQSAITISGSGPVDELRLYPATAQMTTYTYSPLVGMTSQCDINNRITYYEFDSLARLARIRDQDRNILKSYEYQYQASSGCGTNCYIVAMQTLAGSNTLSYPVGVFNANGKLLGNATNQAGYISLWNADTADSHRGTLAAGQDSLHFQITLNTGKTLPPVTGCRYYQVDMAWNKFDGVRSGNGAYVDFGDGTSMATPRNKTDTPSVLAPNTIAYSYFGFGGKTIYVIHTYADTSLKTLTFYHNDAREHEWLDNATSPATGLTRLKNLRGYLPQNTDTLAGSCYQQASMTSLAGITNWNSISSVRFFELNRGDGANAVMHVSYPQDFMQNNKGLRYIRTSSSGYRGSGCLDTSFRLSRLKSNWNTYFTGLQSILINDDHWNREDLSALTQLNFFQIYPSTQDHMDGASSPFIPIPTTAIDNIINQIAAGAGRTIRNGLLDVESAGPARSPASDAAVQTLHNMGWSVAVNGIIL